MLYENEIYGDPCYNINVLMSHAASKMKHDYYEIVMRFGPHKFCFHSYTLRIPWGLCFYEDESSLSD